MPEFQVEFPKFKVNGNENLRALCKYFSDDEDYIHDSNAPIRAIKKNFGQRSS